MIYTHILGRSCVDHNTQYNQRSDIYIHTNDNDIYIHTNDIYIYTWRII